MVCVVSVMEIYFFFVGILLLLVVVLFVLIWLCKGFYLVIYKLLEFWIYLFILWVVIDEVVGSVYGGYGYDVLEFMVGGGVSGMW